MFIKIERQDEPQYHVFECDEFDFQYVDPGEPVAVRDDMFDMVFGETDHPTRVLWIDRKKQILLRGCTIYIMNEAGKTIDVLCS